MKKCHWCNFYTDKCENSNSNNFGCRADFIEVCKSMLKDKSKASEIKFKKHKDIYTSSVCCK